MQIIEVKSKQDKSGFLKLPIRLYKNEKNWIRPLDKDIENIFDPKTNKFFRHGEATRFLLKDNKGLIIGRIAAFINNKTANKSYVKTGGCGFFECINNQEAANILFDTAKKWNEERGMEAMDGPINFGERDKWWGCLVDGYTEPNYTMPYNFEYYQQLFENYGFKLYFKQFTFGRAAEGGTPEKWKLKAQRVANTPGYRFEHINKKNLEKYAEDFRHVYNLAWAKHGGVSTMAKAQAMNIMKQIKPVLDEKIMWFTYYYDEPVGFFLILPELNQIFKHVNGKLDWIGKIKFLYHKLMGTCRKMFGVVFGITPEHQGKGLEAAMVEAMASVVLPLNRYDFMEMNWIGDFNPKMIAVCESVGAKVVKTHHTYRYIFDPNVEFKRMEDIK